MSKDEAVVALAKLLKEVESKPEPLTTGTAMGADVDGVVLPLGAMTGVVAALLEEATVEEAAVGADADAVGDMVGVVTVVGILPVLKNV